MNARYWPCLGVKVFAGGLTPAIRFSCSSVPRTKEARMNVRYNRFVRWSRLGVFNKIFAELARKGGKPERIMIDATHLKAHRTAASLLKKGLFPDVSGAPKAA